MPLAIGDPYIIAGLGAGITAIATLLGLRWKNKHELQLKLLDIQQKKEEQARTDKASLKAKKVQAAEEAGKQLASILNVQRLRQAFFQDMLKNQHDNNYLYNKGASFNHQLQTAIKSQNESSFEQVSMYQLYFAQPIDDSNASRELVERIWGGDRKTVEQLVEAETEIIQYLAQKAQTAENTREYEMLNVRLNHSYSKRRTALEFIILYIGFSLEMINILMLDIQKKIEDNQ
jgi:hypothetical protein